MKREKTSKVAKIASMGFGLPIGFVGKSDFPFLANIKLFQGGFRVASTEPWSADLKTTFFLVLMITYDKVFEKCSYAFKQGLKLRKDYEKKTGVTTVKAFPSK